MFKGHCLCGAIQYQYSGELGPLAMCHCSQCRRAQGTAFATNSPIQSRQFSLVSGGDILTEYESRPGKKRAFCSNCGSPIYSRLDARPDLLRLRIGTLSSPIEARPSHHIYAASKAEWFEIGDQLPRYAELEDGPLL